MKTFQMSLLHTTRRRASCAQITFARLPAVCVWVDALFLNLLSAGNFVLRWNNFRQFPLNS